MKQILIDSDALFALYVSKDAHHEKAKTLFFNYLEPVRKRRKAIKAVG